MKTQKKTIKNLIKELKDKGFKYDNTLSIGENINIAINKIK